MRENIILVTKGNEKRVFSGIKRACFIVPEFNYKSLKDYRTPFKYKGYYFEKLKVN